MKPLLLLWLGLVLITLTINLTQGSVEKTQDNALIEHAIQEATQRYNQQIKLAMINGAKSSEPKKSSDHSREMGRISSIYRDAYEILISSSKMDRVTALKKLREALPQQCQRQSIQCDADYTYRSVNGSCNNLNNTGWGAAGLPVARLLPPSYEGEFDDPRGGKEFAGNGLPSARKVSYEVHSGSGNLYESRVTHMVAQFGQFLDHDITLTPVDDMNCCEIPNQPRDCWNIQIDGDDPHFRGDKSRSCLSFVRSTPHCFPSTDDNRREQMNIITAYIDGSMVYGSTEELFQTLRERQGGRLVENSEHPGFLPWKSDVNMTEDPGKKTVIAGDVRADEMPGLAVLQSLFLREHNRIAKELEKLEPEWNDEKLFQETRRIVAAELQQITYNEFLPQVLSSKKMSEYQLDLPRDHAAFTIYDDLADATIFNSFATAAYRFGHSLVNGLIELYLGNSHVGSYHVRDNYLNVNQVISNHATGKSGYHLILNGLIRQRSQAFDREIHEDLTNYLFANISTMIGHDLAARNIQRGRDHGLPSYNEFRQFCKLDSLSTWENSPKEINFDSWKKLQSVYESPNDIDLYTGGLSEVPVEGAVSGPTFVCLQALQFKKLKDGDRFFFTHQNQVGSFTKEQLVALRKRTFGDIICQNSDLGETQRNVFLVANSTSNPMISCNDPNRQLDLTPFSDSNQSGTGAGSVFTYNFKIVYFTFLAYFMLSFYSMKVNL